ncbi:MAG TPA: DUF1573 domain-containing protein [Bacillota bacterium]|nr:DUF1573 domain-containing protein [Candidatus Fermentithermobacillaceae bacterium]HOK64770.1 DUF1573 domain-containing protein [Bacillota bacterium]HOL12317.1 DUF1573 domain-containing protein [Bacillota bacterium]HPP61055.1 DUF1573 domain-containing protein [Bacillota bacterium]
MEDPQVQKFQETVDEYLIRHKSIVDVLSKISESSGRVNRAVAKAVTSCGCIRINATKQEIPVEIGSLASIRDVMKTHVEGKLCDQCTEILEDEIGRTLFYLAALCNTLGLDFDEILKKEQDRITCLGIFNVM